MKGQVSATNQQFSVSSYFEPDILTSFQYAKVNRRRDHLWPEEKLMFAVLTDAIECFQKYIGSHSRRCRSLHQDAESWILSRENHAPFSFEHICEALLISPSYLRVGLLRWRAEHEAAKGTHRRIREPLRYQYRLRNPRVTASVAGTSTSLRRKHKLSVR